jgi:hypothetical protein
VVRSTFVYNNGNFVDYKYGIFSCHSLTVGVKLAMAERGAHLTPTSHAKPSIFEVIAQDSLSVTFHPALKRIATVKKKKQLIKIR